MKLGKHQLRWQFNSLTHNPTKPIRFTLDNGNYDTNFVIDTFEIIWGSMDGRTNNVGIASDTHQVVLALTEAGATPSSQATVNNRPYALRVADRRQIAWGQMDDNQQQTILDPHNIIAQDLWLNAWAFGPAHDPSNLLQDIGVLITMSEVKQSGARALLQAVRDEPLN